jgi:hypothetical protein
MQILAERLCDVPVKHGRLMLPEDSTIVGNVDATDLWACDGPRSGEPLGYYGSAHVTHTYVTQLPKNLTIDGNLCLEGCIDFKTLPKGLIIKGSLILDYAFMNRLPSDIVVERSISTFGNNFLVPKTARVGHIWCIP